MPKHEKIKSKLFAAASAMILGLGTANAASTIESEFELRLPREFQQSLIDQKWKTLQTQVFQTTWQLPNQVVIGQENLEVHLDTLSLAVKSNLEKPSLPTDKNVLMLQSKNLQSRMVIGKIWVDQEIEKVVGGITGRFRIKAQCDNVVLNMRSNAGIFSMTLLPNVQPDQLGSQVQEVNLSWQPDAWTIQNFSCTGVEGFEDIVRQEITKAVQDSKSFIDPRKDLIKSYIAQYLGNIKLDLSQERELVSARSDVKVKMYIDNYDDSATGAVVAKGRLVLDFTRSSHDGKKTLALSTKPVTNTSTQATLRLPADFAKAVMTEAYSANSWVHQIYSNQLPGFDTIMNSRFNQFFVWPALMDYPKSTKFLFDVYSNKDPKIDGTGMQYKVSLDLLSKMQLPVSKGYIPFMNFTLPFATTMKFAIQSSKLNATFMNPDLDLKYQWDPTYVKKYGPNQKFGASTIRTKVLDSITGKTVSVSLPSIPIMTGVTLQVKSAQGLSNSDLQLQLAP